MNKILKKVDKAYQAIAVGFILTLFVTIFLQIILRNFFNSGSVHLEELARYSMVSLVFITIPVLTFRNGHIVVDFIPLRLPAKVQRWIAVVNNLLVMFFGVYILAAIVSIMQRNWNVRTPGLNMPNALFYLPVFLGILAMTIVSLLGVFMSFTNKGESV